MVAKEKPETKTIGGAIPVELFWEFKKAQAARHENATQALEHAIQLYLDCQPEDYADYKEAYNAR